MISKVFTPKRTVCKVTFNIPAEWASKEVAVVGDFNDWNPKATKLKKKNGNWEGTVRLQPNSEVRFRYFIDGQNWANDEKADGYIPNSYGSEDSVIKIGE